MNNKQIIITNQNSKLPLQKSKNILNKEDKAPSSGFSRFEKRHRSVGGNALRAAVLGANDGLLSTFSFFFG